MSEISAQYEYDIGEFFVTALINGDMSGLSYYGSKEDIARFKAFEKEIENATLQILEDYEIYFDRCDITGEMSDCVRLLATYFNQGE